MSQAQGTGPVRVQRRRTKGFRLQDASQNGLPVVYVGRPTKWGNPFKPGTLVSLGGGFTDDIVLAFRILATNHNAWAYQKEARQELGGKDLACWCPLEDKNGNRVPCHADVLLEIANA